jgi:hypothetical protein
LHLVQNGVFLCYAEMRFIKASAEGKGRSADKGGKRMAGDQSRMGADDKETGGGIGGG